MTRRPWTRWSAFWEGCRVCPPGPFVGVCPASEDQPSKDGGSRARSRRFGAIARRCSNSKMLGRTERSKSPIRRTCRSRSRERKSPRRSAITRWWWSAARPARARPRSCRRSALNSAADSTVSSVIRNLGGSPPAASRRESRKNSTRRWEPEWATRSGSTTGPPRTPGSS